MLMLFCKNTLKMRSQAENSISFFDHKSTVQCDVNALEAP